jgi:RNA polymerase sigma-70 factor (ECF subfamily)
MSESTTRLLFEQARLGATDDVNAFYERCARKLLPIIRLKLGPSPRPQVESRDILQTVLCKSVGKLDRVRDAGAVMSWLARAAENEIRDQVDFHTRQRRDAARRAPLDDAAGVPAPVRQALSQAIVNEELGRLEAALESLPEAQRDIIVLRRLEELSFGEIGARLGKTEDACRMAFSRAMAALVLRLQPPSRS